jgi:hypothetical protein
MATTDEFNAAEEQMKAQIDALEAQKEALAQSYRRPNLLPREFQQESSDRHHREVAAIQSQINAINRQYQTMAGQYRRSVTDQNQAARIAEAQQKRQEALVKAADAERKLALTDTQKKLAGILGVKPDQVDDKLSQAEYDPRTHKLVVPTKTPTEAAADREARQSKMKTFSDNLKEGYAVDDIGTGKKINVHPENIFGDRPLPYKEADGKRVYMLNGKPYAIIPSDDFKGLKENYDELTTRPVADGKMVDPDLYNAARNRIASLGGDVPKDIVGETQALVEQRGLAAPALNPQRGFAPGLLPSERVIPALPVESSTAPNSYPPVSLPATTAPITPAMVGGGNLLNPNITARLPAKSMVIPALGDIPTTTVDLPKQTLTVPFQQNVLGNPYAYEPSLQSTMENRMEAFRPEYRTQNQLSRAAVNQAVLNAGGVFSKEDVLAASDYADQLGIPQGDPRRGDVTKAFLERKGAENQRPADDYKMMATPVDAASRLEGALMNTNPVTGPLRVIGKAVPDLLSGGANLSMYPDKSAQRAELEKRFVQEQNNGVIGPNTNMDEYVNFFMNGPQPTNQPRLVP